MYTAGCTYTPPGNVFNDLLHLVPHRSFIPNQGLTYSSNHSVVFNSCPFLHLGLVLWRTEVYTLFLPLCFYAGIYHVLLIHSKYLSLQVMYDLSKSVCALGGIRNTFSATYLS